MKTHAVLPQEIHQEVENTLRDSQGTALPVYAAAEKIRKRWEVKNVALEDIIELLVECSGGCGVAIAFDPEEARLALLGTAEQETVEIGAPDLNS